MDAIAELKAGKESLQGQIEEVEKWLEEVLEQQGKIARNSSELPSSDFDRQRNLRRRESSSTRQRGAQPGCKKFDRLMHPSDQIVQMCQPLPDRYCRCGGNVVIATEPSIRHQVIDLPPPRYLIDEHQGFDVQCE